MSNVREIAASWGVVTQLVGFFNGNVYNGVICDQHSLYSVRFYAANSVGRLIITSQYMIKLYYWRKIYVIYITDRKKLGR